MRILFVNCVYSSGSTGKIVFDTVGYLREHGHEAFVVYGNGRKAISFGDSQVHKITFRWEQVLHVFLTRLGISLMYGGMPFATYRLIKLINRVCPDVVHLHCINGNTINIFRVLRFLGDNKIPTVVTHHAEFYYTGNCGHSFTCRLWFEKECRGCKNFRYATNSYTWSTAHRSWCAMKKAFNCFEKNNLVFTAVSPWVLERASFSPIVKGFRCEVVKNGVETAIFHPHFDYPLLRERISNLKSKIVFHCTAFFWPDNRNHIKGGWYVVEMARRFPDVTFIIAAIRTKVLIELPDNIYVWGRTTSQMELAMLYSSANVTLVPSQKETYSMICAESLCCGTPVIGFLSGGPESISLHDYSYFVSYGDIEALERVLSQCLSRQFDNHAIAHRAKEEYDKAIMAEKYVEIYKGLLHNSSDYLTASPESII